MLANIKAHKYWQPSYGCLSSIAHSLSYREVQTLAGASTANMPTREVKDDLMSSPSWILRYRKPIQGYSNTLFP
jgi:hypothetical protein